MKNKKEKKKAYILSHSKRHNTCPICGGEALMTFPSHDLCRAVCQKCGKLNIEFGFASDYADTVEDTCRRPFNMLVLNEYFSSTVLSSMGLQNGDYVVLDDNDGYICFAGNEIEVARYVVNALDSDPESFHMVFRLAGDTFYPACTSYLVEAALRHDRNNRS